MKKRILDFLHQFSFRTGLIVMALCIPCYIMSFAQFMLPVSATTKGVLFTIFFGLAKTFQYSGLTIVGVEGVNRIKSWWKNKKTEKN